MSINFNGINNGLILDGSVDIDNIEFEPGVGIKSVSGMRRHDDSKFVNAEEVPEAEYTEVGEASAVEEHSDEYPEITDINRCLFVEKVKNDAKEKVYLPVDELLHTIYDLTTDWDPKLNSVHKWRVLYETLSRMGYLYLEQRPRYTSFVKAVVMYCFPDTEDKYGGNIKKTALDTEYTNWSYEDKALFQELKKALDIQTLTSPK